MTPAQAIELLTKVTEQLPLTRLGHQQVLLALEVISTELAKIKK